MHKLAMFVPLAKADAAQRLVYGSFTEAPDRANEVFDYATSKAHFQAWSAEMQKASGGKSLGNIRGQHNKGIAAGKLLSMEFDDAAKRIDFCGKIVDDAEWAKVEEGVYTGFSPGGSYAKKWPDGKYTRYTARPRELSIVDVPCNPQATFTMIKTDGAEEETAFVIGKAYEPGNEATKARAEELAKAAGPDAKAKDYVVQARADLIAEQAGEELAKLADAAVDDEEDQPAEKADDPLAVLDAALAKADAALNAAAPAGDRPEPTALQCEGQEMAKMADALGLIASADVPSDELLLAKGLYTVRRTASLLSDLANVLLDVSYEEKAEGDTASPLPAMAAELVTTAKAFLISMANEEVAEIMAQAGRDTGFAFAVPAAEGDVAKAAQDIVDAVKADADLMEKAAARLPALPDAEEMEKLESLSAENERLSKRLTEIVPSIEALTKSVTDLNAARSADRKTIAELQAKLEKVAASPSLEKGARMAPPKGEDEPAAAPDKQAPMAKGASFHERLANEPDRTRRAQMILHGHR